MEGTGGGGLTVFYGELNTSIGPRAAGRARAAEVMATYVPMYSASSSLAAAPGARRDPSFDKRKISKKKQAKNGQKL